MSIESTHAPGGAGPVFEGFIDERLDVGEVRLRVRHGGDGPAVLLIHGHPRTSATWHRVAPLLVDNGFTVVCPDMRGYGESTGAPVRRDHGQQSKRTVANDLLTVMDMLGHDQFSAVGHDRGSYVALRLALDHQPRVSHLVVLDGVPISEALARCDAEFARRWFHWFFFAQEEVPERVINADPEAWYGGDAERMGRGNFAEYQRAINDPDTVLAMLEDYRAGVGVDRADELADRSAGRTVTCPTMLLWSTGDDLEDLYGDPLSVWSEWTDDLRGHPIESGHHMAEDNPADLAADLSTFFVAGPLT